MNRLALFLFALLVSASCSKYTWDYPDMIIKPLSINNLAQQSITVPASVKTTIIHFWAYNHPLSRQSLNYMNELNRQAKENGLRFVSICLNWAGSQVEVMEFMKTNRFEFETVYDSESRFEKMYRVTSIPQTLIIDNSVVTHRLMGLREDLGYPSAIIDKAR